MNLTFIATVLAATVSIGIGIALIMTILGFFARWLRPPITLDMYSQRQQEDFYFWIHEAEQNV